MKWFRRAFNTAGEQTAYKTGFADGFALQQVNRGLRHDHYKTLNVARRLSQLR
jgi:hypothetical protein